MSEAPHILVVRPGILKPKQLKELKNSNFIVIETNDLESVRFLKTEYAVIGDVISTAAIMAVTKSGYDSVAAKFGYLVAQGLLNNPNTQPGA